MLLKQFSVLFVVIMIASMGFTIALKDFKGFFVEMVLNFVFAPLICFALAFIIPQKDLNGDVPLAVVINTGTMILAPFFMLWLAGSYALAMLLNLIIAGMLLREFAERKTDVKKYLISAICAVFLMFIAIPVILKNLNLLPPLLASTVAIFPILFISAYFLSGKLFDRAKNIAITYSCGMKNLPIALAIAIMSFGTLTALPIAVAFAFQMLTAVTFYRIYRAKRGGLSV